MSEEMTIEQARDTLRNAAWLGTDEEREQIEKAVELLCGEPCEYAIDRHAVLDMMQMRLSGKELYKAVYELPPVTPKQRTGHWIETAEEYYKAVNEYGGGVDENTPYFTDNIGCSVCLAMFSTIDNETERFNYCPHCGVKIVEPQEREDKE